MDFAVVPERTALINVDLLNMFVDGTPDGLAIVERVNRLVAACRAAGILVVHTSHVLRPDGSNMGILREVSEEQGGLLANGAPSAALHPQLVLDPRDLLLEKPRFDTLLISDVSTNACCDTTAREAYTHDFHVPVLSDGTASPEGSDFQQATCDILEHLFAQVLTAEAVLQKIADATTQP
jgi:ureidoacrylate peracid hydrolase